jgi:hypothetical protein
VRDFWLKILGIDAGRIPADAQTEWVFTHGVYSWKAFVFVAAALALVYGVFFLYRRERTDCPAIARIFLGLVRALVLLLLLLVFLGPALSIVERKTLRPNVVVMLDESLSMSIRDDYQDGAVAARVKALNPDTPAGDINRGDIVNALLREDNRRFLNGIETKGRLKLLSFADTVRNLTPAAPAAPPDADPDAPAAPDPSREIPALKPAGPASNMARAIREALRIVAGQPVAALVVVSDGQSTEGEATLQAAELAVQQDIPIFALGVGEPTAPRNWKVDEVWAPESVFRNNPFVLQARLLVSGAEPDPVPVELLVRPAGSGTDTAARDTLLERRTVNIDAENGTADLAFKLSPEVAGDFLYTVRIPAMARERLLDDNVKTVPVKVLSEQANVLLVSGAPSWEYRMVRTLLTRDKTINLSCWLQSMDMNLAQDGNTRLEKLPATDEEWFRYDVIMMFDPDPRDFGAEWLASMERYLNEHGGGLFWMAGSKYSARFFREPRTRDIVKLLPVVPSPVTAGGTDILDSTFSRAWPMRLTADGSDHVVFRLHENPLLNRELVERMPGVFWSYPVQHAKPGAVILLEHSDPRLRTPDGLRPLFVSGQYGAGKTAFMGFSGTWRWRKLGERFFNQWWIQVTRHLMEGRLLGGRTRGRLMTDRDVYAIGDRVNISARLFDSAYKPLEETDVPVRLFNGPTELDGAVLKLIDGQPGRYAGSLVAGEKGLHELRLSLTDPQQAEPVLLRRQFTVEMPRVEFADPRLNRPLLQELCERTGGRYFEITTAQALPASIPNRQETVAIPARPIDLWDTDRLLIALVVLLTIEWAMRKRYKML